MKIKISLEKKDYDLLLHTIQFFALRYAEDGDETVEQNARRLNHLMTKMEDQNPFTRTLAE